VVKIIAKHEIIAIDIFFRRELEGDAVLVFVLVMRSKVEVRRGIRRVFWQATIRLALLTRVSLRTKMDTHLDSDIEIHRDVLGVDRGGLRLVDRDDLVLGNVIFRPCSHLQNVIVRHDSFVFTIGFSMLWFLEAYAKVTRDQ
jgi:hypothetical protein